MLNNVCDEELIENRQIHPKPIIFQFLPKVGHYFELSGIDYYKGFHSFVLLGKLAKTEFGKSVHWTEQKVHFD